MPEKITPERPSASPARPRRIDLSRLAPLRDKLPPGREEFDLHAFRERPYDPALRD